MLIICHFLFLFFLNAEVSEMSSRLTSESRIYADKAKDLNRQVSLIVYYLILHIATLITRL